MRVEFRNINRILCTAIVLLVCLQIGIYGETRIADSDNNLSIALASGWTVEKSPENPVILLLRGSADSGANVNIIPEQSAAISLDDYEKLSEANMASDSSLADFVILTREVTKISGVDARYWIYTAKIGKDKVPVKCKVVFVSKSGTTYVITCGAPLQEYNALSPVFDQMLESIVWTKKPPLKAKAVTAKPVRKTDKSKVLSVVVPNGWSMDARLPEGALMLLKGPPATSSISILSEKVGDMTLIEYEQASSQNAENNTDNFKLESQLTTMVGGKPARRWIYTSTYGETKIPLKCIVYLIIHKKIAYTITLGSVQSQFEEAKPVFGAFAKSIKWTK